MFIKTRSLVSII